MSRIISIGTASPPYSVDQNTILDYMQHAYDNETASRKLNALFHSSGIYKRYSAVPDFDGRHHPDNFFSRPIPEIEKRLGKFKETAVELAIQAVSNALEKLHTDIVTMEFSHLITVTCTGILAPGIDSMLMEKLELPNDIFHTSLNFLGCNAAFPSMKIADAIARTEANARILVVCVELCTLHFQPKDNTDNLLSNTIFGDGAAAYIVVNDEYARLNNLRGLNMKGHYASLLHDGKDLMGWNITPVNFEMILSPKIPDFIGDNMLELMPKIWRNLQLLPEKIDYWAVHPGGRKILDIFKKKMNLGDEKMVYSYRILNDFGNMSSATILFVISEILKNNLKQGDIVFSMGFGPGISIDTSWFTYA
jgi:predicted naringenin-chalcone synthase